MRYDAGAVTRRLALVLLLAAGCRAGLEKAAPGGGGAAGLPADDPVARYGLAWTGALRWGTVVSIEDFPGPSLLARFEAAQAAVVARGGGVVYFPPGVYRFEDGIALASGVVIRGADPGPITDARREGYDPPTRFLFPRYQPRLEGNGTPIESAFKGIRLADPGGAENVGVVNLSLDHGHVHFGETRDHRAGRNRLVFGCVLRHAAVATREVPDAAAGQHAWQRFTDRFRAAIHVFSGENLLVANNRLPPSSDSFVMPGYVLAGKDGPVVPAGGVTFDYDNRPGIAANRYALGGEGGSGADGTPASHPHGFRKGIVIRDNYVYSTGRAAISFSGDGTLCARNVIRFARGVTRPTTTGANVTSRASTNDNRAVEMRGWRWRVEGNDYEVHRNLSADLVHPVNDGEGLMHEDHANSTVVDSRVADNRGNAYISIYKTGGIQGLLVQGNDVRTGGGSAAIYVVANRNSGKFPCRDVAIVGNVTAGSGIRLACDPSGGNVIRGNVHVGLGGKIKLEAEAVLEDNEGYGLER